MLFSNVSSFIWGLFICSVASVLMKSAQAISESSSSVSSRSRLKTAREMPASSDLGGGTPPWQSVSGSGMTQEQRKYDDVPPIVFSPTGRLHSIESTARATTAPFNPTSNLVVALTCKDGLVVISTVPMSPHLNSSLLLVNDTAVPVLTHLSPSLAAATAGNAIDCQVMRHKVHRLVDSILGAKGDLTGPAFLARRLADNLQVATQTIGGKGGRMLVSSVVILGDKQVWRIDPTGQFLNCHAVAIGYGSDKAQVELFQQVIRRSKDDQDCELFFANLGLEEAIEIAGECIEKTIFPKNQDGQGSSTPSLSIPWYGLVMDYSGVTASNRVPKRKILRGKFAPTVVESS